MNVEGVYGVFALLAIFLFRVLTPSRAVLVVFLGGWLLLPVGNYPQGSALSVFPYWIVGLALPSDMLLTKAWVAPAVAMLGVIAFDRAALRRLRLKLADMAVMFWCCWPMLQAALLPSDPGPSAILACLYLTGTWGLSWLLGRLYYATPAGRIEVLQALGLAGLACLPISLVEGAFGPMTYGWLYELHPFRLDGAERYLGYRPIGMFEHGNQFGIWVSLCAVAAVWAALARRSASGSRRPVRFIAAICVSVALAAQSVGALFLALFAVGLLAINAVVRPRFLTAVAVGALLVGGTVYLSGAAPIERIARETRIGQSAVEAFRSIGRNSLTWRVAQDQALAASASEQALVGSGTWDWWRGEQRRPWGLPLLLIGQFGAIGLLLAYLALGGTAFATAWRAARQNAWRAEAAPIAIAVIVSMAMIDSFLNSFLFFPALLMAGALTDEKL